MDKNKSSDEKLAECFERVAQPLYVIALALMMLAISSIAKGCDTSGSRCSTTHSPARN